MGTICSSSGSVQLLNSTVRRSSVRKTSAKSSIMADSQAINNRSLPKSFTALGMSIENFSVCEKMKMLDQCRVSFIDSHLPKDKEDEKPEAQNERIRKRVPVLPVTLEGSTIFKRRGWPDRPAPKLLHMPAFADIDGHSLDSIQANLISDH